MTAKFARPWALAIAALAVAACGRDQVGEDLLEPVHAGMPRDSVLALMGTGPLTATFADTLRLDHGFRVERFLIEGKTYEVLYYREKPGTVTEPVEQYTETPVVLTEGKVLGWGWEYYVETAMAEFKLPTPIKEQPPAQPQGVPGGAPASAPAPRSGSGA